MTNWSLTELFSGLHDKVQSDLTRGRRTLAHPVSKGDASEKVWLRAMQTYLPHRYQVESAHVVDSDGNFSEQIDVLIFDRQYSPFIFTHEGEYIVPAESVYAAFETKQTINAEQVAYAQKKVASVRILKQTSLPIPYAKGTYPPKEPIHILGGILTLDNGWSSGFGEPLKKAVCSDSGAGRLDIGCVASQGLFWRDRQSEEYQFSPTTRPSTEFIFKLISELQFSGTVPMIDVQAYAKWLKL